MKLSADLLDSLMDEWFELAIRSEQTEPFGPWVAEKFSIEDKELQEAKSMHVALGVIYERYI